MKRIIANYQSNKVNVFIKDGLVKKIGSFIREGKVLIVTDSNLANIYLPVLKNVLSGALIHIIEAGEEQKNLEEVSIIIGKLLAADFIKTDTIVAFGGGKITDIVGFIASIYKRGINFISVPTSLLAQVDSALGGKSGINYNNYKNQIGTFYHPKVVVVDPELLKTLPHDEYLSGLGEVIKYGLVFDSSLFEYLFTEFKLSTLIYHSLTIKAKVTMKDEFDKDRRFLLNYGHTVGHALESIFDFKIKHGIAVAAGLYYETKDLDIRNKILDLTKKLGINIIFEFSKNELVRYIYHDKKVRNNTIKVPVLERLGKAKIYEVDIEEYIRGLL